MINPRNIHCLALNYGGVGVTNEEPLYFVKPLSSLCFEDSEINYPENITQLWTEVELGIVVARDCRNIIESEAYAYIEGYTVCADLTCNNVHDRNHHLGFSKCRKDFCPTKNSIVKIDLKNKSSLRLSTEINGEITQTGDISDMRYNPFEAVAYLSQITTLLEGDLILTGTPPGHENNVLKRGDQIKQSIDDVGEFSYAIV